MDEATKAIAEALHQHLGRWDELIAGKLAATIEAAGEKVAVAIDRAAAQRTKQTRIYDGIADELETIVTKDQIAAPSQVRATLYAAASILRRL